MYIRILKIKTVGFAPKGNVLAIRGDLEAKVNDLKRSNYPTLGFIVKLIPWKTFKYIGDEEKAKFWVN